MRRDPLSLAGIGLLLCLLPCAPSQSLSVDEGSGTVLEARGDAVVRRDGDTESRLEELPGRPTGKIRQFERDPHGGTFVAAEHGIFLVHPSVDTIDRVDLGDGAPEGSPMGIVLDDARRLWIATDRAFGVVNTGFFYGRSGDYPGVPPPPYTGLRRHPEGGLEVLTATGAFRYVPDQGAPPVVGDVTIDGEVWSRGTTVRRTWPVAIGVDATGRATGGATLRWVTDGHHNWRALPDGGRVIDGLNPGNRTIELVALDRDLRRSKPVVVPVRCAYATWLRPKVLLGSVGALAGLLVWVFLMHARRAGGGRARYARALVSVGLLMFIVLQIAAGVFPHARGWPFCGFSMYTGKSYENQIGGPVTMAIATPTGEVVEANLRRFQLVFDTKWQVIRPFLNGDEAFRQTLVNTYNAAPGGPKARALRVVQYRTRLTRNGKVPVAPLVMGAIEAGR